MPSEAENEKTVMGDEVPHSVASAPPVQPGKLLKWASEQLAMIPWAACGAMGTALGIAMLYFYFASIDYVPADISSVLSASFLMAWLALAFYMWLIMGLLAPLAAYRGMDLHVDDDAQEARAPRSTGVSGLWALQLIGVGGLLLFISAPHAIQCVSFWAYPLIAGAVCIGAGAFGWWHNELANACRRRAWKKRLGPALLVSMIGSLPCIVLFHILLSGHGADWPHLVALLVVWLTVVALSAFIDRVPVWGCALMLIALSPILMYSLPTLMGFPAYFPTKIAQIAGIRAEGAAELRMPSKACKLIESAVAGAKTARPVNCNEDADWGTVHALVLSNLGERWLIELQLDGVEPVGRNGSVRVTIPGADVQIVRRMPPPAATDKASGCRT
jgi:hypothetical protein